MPRVTIGLPVYNGARFLAEALESLLAQDYTDFEIVVSDNASSDDTPQILEGFVARDKRIRVVRKASTVIAHQNFNDLVDEAAGSLFAWAACDDLRAPTFLSALVSALDAHPDAVLAYCDPSYIGDRTRVPSHLPAAGVEPPGLEPTPLRRAITQLRVTSWLPVYGLMRTDVVRRSRRFFFPMGIAADVGIVIELAMHGTLICVREPLITTRLRSDSLAMDRRDPIHGELGRRFDDGVRRFIEGLGMNATEQRIFSREVAIYCRKAQRPRRHLWRSGAFRSLYVRLARAANDLSRRLHGL